MNEIIERLKKRKETISIMESCTGGFLANEITNNEGSSEVFKFGAVTYSNEFKIKMGIDKDLIEQYSVYSQEVACNMAKSITDFTNSDYGIGVTGKLKRIDKRNLNGENDLVYVSIYSKFQDKFYNLKIKVIYSSRKENKEFVYKEIIKKLYEIIK